MPESVALLYSGGTDSTLAAWQAAQRFDRVHLLTYRRFGMFGVENSELNLNALRRVVGEDPFIRPPIMDVERLFRHVSYEHYGRDLLKHRFMVLTTCGLCKLAMHLRTLVYAVDEGVDAVWDGANKAMTIFPAQMPEVLEMIRGLYQIAGIRYENPVYDYDDAQGIDFGSQFWGLNPKRDEVREQVTRTTGTELYELGLLPEPDVKGTAHDKKMQGRCYQMVLFNVWARWYHLQRHDMERYRRDVLAYYADKIGRLERVVAEHLRDPEHSRLRALCEARP